MVDPKVKKGSSPGLQCVACLKNPKVSRLQQKYGCNLKCQNTMKNGRFLPFSIDCSHIYVPKGVFWGSKGRPHIGDLVMSLFLLWGPPFMTGDGPKMVHFGPKIAKHGWLVNVPKWCITKSLCNIFLGHPVNR